MVREAWSLRNEGGGGGKGEKASGEGANWGSRSDVIPRRNPAGWIRGRKEGVP